MWVFIYIGGSCIGDDKFHCSNGRCIRKANVCDAHCDCLPAGNFEYYGVNGTCEDEQNCEEFYSEENGKWPRFNLYAVENSMTNS